MKVFYTKKFKEAISKPYSIISLGKYKLRAGTETGFTELTSDNLNDRQFLSACSPSSLGQDKYYSSEMVKYNGGLQICLDIPQSDSSLYLKVGDGSYYQLFLFYFTDNTNLTPSTSLGFVVYSDFDGSEFSGLNITSSRNIITIPNLSWVCNMTLTQDTQTSLLEDTWGQEFRNITALEKDDVSKEVEYISKLSYSKFWVDHVSEDPYDTDWLETVYINNYGLKIY